MLCTKHIGMVLLGCFLAGNAQAVQPMVAAGCNYALALKTDGSVVSWGRNDYGQLGNGLAAMRSAPAKVAGIDHVVSAIADIVAIAAGEHLSYAISADGRVWASGSNAQGELGSGSTAAYELAAFPIEGVAGFRRISGGVGSAVALRTDGTVWAWGRNFEGQLGDATYAERNTPVPALDATASQARNFWSATAATRRK